MSRRMLNLTAVTLLLPGCVFVNQPLSDAEKAEPDKRLLGKWDHAWNLYEIDSPAVKGNPKGIMHLRGAQHDFWFFTTTIGKHTYWTVYLEEGGFADFSQEGAFEKWNKGDYRLYEIVLSVLEGDRLTVVHGEPEQVGKVMKAELIPQGEMGKEAIKTEYFKTPPGWLAKYLEKNGPGTLYNDDDRFRKTWRRAEAAKKERTAAAKAWRKAQEEATRKAEQRKAEQLAASYLKYAKKLVDTGMVEEAKERLREIIEDFPNTEAGKEAKQLLNKMGK